LAGRGGRRGDRANEMYFLLRGSVRLSRDPPPDPARNNLSEAGGDDSTLEVAGGAGAEGFGIGTVDVGDIFGELALFPGARGFSDAGGLHASSVPFGAWDS
jgi:hypothetical protein